MLLVNQLRILLCIAVLQVIRPDISYVVQHICLFMHDPLDTHFSALYGIFAMFEALWVMAYSCFLLRHLLWLHILMLIGMVALILVGSMYCVVFGNNIALILAGSRYCVFFGNNIFSRSSKRQVILMKIHLKLKLFIDFAYNII